MNAVEIADAIADLFAQPLDPAEFPYAFLRAFANKDTTIARLRSGNTNKSDLGGVLQRNNIHIVVAQAGLVAETLAALRDSPATARHKAKFILATDGDTIEAEEVGGGESLGCDWSDFPDHFGMFLPLAGVPLPLLRCLDRRREPDAALTTHPRDRRANGARPTAYTAESCCREGMRAAGHGTVF